jgi:hypothetical protein
MFLKTFQYGNSTFPYYQAEIYLIDDGALAAKFLPWEIENPFLSTPLPTGDYESVERISGAVISMSAIFVEFSNGRRLRLEEKYGTMIIEAISGCKRDSCNRPVVSCLVTPVGHRSRVLAVYDYSARDEISICLDVAYLGSVANKDLVEEVGDYCRAYVHID